jgi:hypothetical protein
MGDLYMKRLKAFSVLLSFIILLVSCSTNFEAKIPVEMDNIIAAMSAAINTKDTQLYMECIDSKNPEFYAEQYHMFQDIQNINISDFKLIINGISMLDDDLYKADLEQSWNDNEGRHALKYQGIFKKINDSYKFSDLYFNYLNTEHYIVKYSPSLKSQADSLKTVVEDAYDIVNDVYGSVPKNETVIKMYDDNDVFNWFIKPSIDFDMAGWYEYPESIKINMSPGITKRYDDSNFKDRYLAVISHELTHRISTEESANNMPYWMAEGLATLVEHNGRLNLSKPQKNIEQLEKVNLEKLTDSKQISQYYMDSYINISLFIDRFGMDKLHDIIKGLGKYPLQQKTGGQSIDESNSIFHEVLKSSMSMTVEELDSLLK